jgi:glutathione S-transferase
VKTRGPGQRRIRAFGACIRADAGAMLEVFQLRAEEQGEWSGLSLVLYGYRYSVYLRIARIVLAEKGAAYRGVEVNSFAADMPKEYLDLHPFGRVPTLVHGDFVLYETEAITRCLDEAFSGPALQSTDPRQRARTAQIISILDSYGYAPMVRQAFSQRIFEPSLGRPADETQIRSRIESSLGVLGALEPIAAPDGPVAGGTVWSFADFHLAPMMAYISSRRRESRSAASKTVRMVGGHAPTA